MKNSHFLLLLAGLSYAGLPFITSQDRPQYEHRRNTLTSEVSRQAQVPPPVTQPGQLQNPLVLAPAITATNTYTITRDDGVPGASAGDELEHTITITNSGTDAFNVIFEDIIDANTTLVPESVKSTPIAQDDAYTTIGNVGLTISEEEGLLSNDFNTDGAALLITTTSPISTTEGGTVTVDANTGAFTYSPAVGFSGTDSFTYTVKGASDLTATATVTITLNGRIWFIDASATPTGANGTLETPFATISAFQAINNGSTSNAQNDDYIFMYSASGNYDGSFSLRDGQKLIGQGATASLLDITGLPTPDGSNLLPATGGVHPTLTTTTSSTNAINVMSNNLIRGLNIGTTTGSKIAGSAVGTLTINEVSLTGSGPALNLQSGILNAEFGEISVTATNAPGIFLGNFSGSLVCRVGSIITSGNTALNISGSSAAVPLNLDLSFSSVSSSNSVRGIALSNTTGAFVVSGNGTPGSGGTISNISLRGVQFTNASGITLKNMIFTNANTTEGVSVTDGNNTLSNAAIYASNVIGLRLENIAVNGTTVQQGINLNNVANFHLINSSIANSGGGNGNTQEEGCIYAINTSGTCSIVNSSLAFPSGRAAYFRNNNVNLGLLTVDNSVFQNAYHSAGFLFEGWGASVMNLKVQNNSLFLRNQTTGLAIYANETSTINADVLNSRMDPYNPVLPAGEDIGTGIDIAASNSATIKFNVNNNIIKARGATAANVFVNEDAYAEGTLQGNTVTMLGGGGFGIWVHSQGLMGNKTARAVVKISNNIVNGPIQDRGIVVESTSQAGGRVDATITGNNVGVNPETGYVNIDINAVGGGLPTSTAYSYNGKICANISNNVIPSDSTGSSGVARIRSGTPATGPNGATEILLQGTGSNASEIWTGNGNTAGFLDVYQNGTFQVGPTVVCAVPANPTLRLADSEPPVEEAPGESPVTAPQHLPRILKKTNRLRKGENPSTTTTNTAKKPSSARTQAGETVRVDGTGSGFTLPANQEVLISFRVTINEDIPANVCSVSNQGSVAGTGFDEVLTNDPEVPGTNNPTVTPIVAAPLFSVCPESVTRTLYGEECVSPETFTAAATGCPAPALTYKIGEQVLSFPYDFPTGITTVSVTASNGVGADATCTFDVTVTCTPLPVTLSEFLVRKEQNTALLTWKTTSETNSDKFVVQHSLNAQVWHDIASITARGESSGTATYSFTHTSPVTGGASDGRNYYRLKMVDRDASYDYSRIESLKFEQVAGTNIYPNPVSDELRLKVSDWSKVRKVEMYDMTGRLIFGRDTAPGISAETIPVKGYPPGSYTIRITYLNGSATSYKVLIAP